MVDCFEHEKRRISTSSQTNYPDTEKVLFSKPFVRQALMNQTKNKVRMAPFQIPFIRTKYSNEKKSRGQGRESGSPNVLGSRGGREIAKGKERANEGYIELPIVNARIKNMKIEILEYGQRFEKKATKKKHRNAKSEGIGDELFKGVYEKLPKKKEREYSMHKTFYDILEELNLRKKEKQWAREENDNLFFYK
jgi:hypothetical protein